MGIYPEKAFTQVICIFYIIVGIKKYEFIFSSAP